MSGNHCVNSTSRSKHSKSSTTISKSEKTTRSKVASISERNSDRHKEVSTASTPKGSSGGVKRFLTPSPINASDSSKKVRQLSDEQANISGLPAMEEDATHDDILGVLGVMGGMPDGPSGLKTVVTELKELIQKQITDIEGIVNKAADTALSRFPEKLPRSKQKTLP